jgi:hypothetical protein
MTSGMNLDNFRIEDDVVRLLYKRTGTQDECFAGM